MFFIIDDFFIVDEVNCLFLCFLYLYYLLLFLFFYPFVTPLRWWVCVWQGVLTNVTQLRSHYVLPFPYSFYLSLFMQLSTFDVCQSWFVFGSGFSCDIDIDCFSSLMIFFIVDEVNCLFVCFLYLCYLLIFLIF